MRISPLALILSTSLAITACGDDTDGDGPLASCDPRQELTNELFAGGTVLAAGTCWTANEQLSLSDGTVTIEEGVSIWFGSGVGVRVQSGGRLRIAGTVTNPVELTTDDPLVTWDGIFMDDSQGTDNDWQYVTITNAGADGWSGAGYSAAGVYMTGSTTLSMDNVTIDNSQDNGLVALADVNFSFSNGTLSNSDVPAYLHPNVVSSLGSETVFSGNTTDVVRVVFGNNDAVEQAQTWPTLAVPYRVDNRFYVREALTLTPGTTIEFVQDAHMIVDQTGSLSAEGTASDAITFRASSAGTRGFWKGIQIAVGGTTAPLQYGATFDHVIVEDGGGQQWSGATLSNASLYLQDSSSALITNTTFGNSEGFALWASTNARIDGFAANTFTGNQKVMRLHPNRVGELAGSSTISGNDDDRIHVVFGNNDRADVAATWKDLGVPYAIDDRFYIDAAVTIDAGATFEFAQDGKLIVETNGSLTTNGTAMAPVTFTGMNPVAAGYWTGIRFMSNTASNDLTHTVFEYTGSDFWSGDPESDAAINLDSGAALSLTDVSIGPGGGYGIYLAATDSMLSCSSVTFSGLVDGAIWDDDAPGILAGCP